MALSAGLNLIVTTAIAAPAAITLASDTPAVLRWAELHTPDAAPPPVPATALLGASVTPTAHGAAIAVRAAPTAERLRMVLEVYEDGPSPRHGGAAVLPFGSALLELDVGAGTLLVNGQPAPLSWELAGIAGDYFAALWIYQGETLLRRLPLLRWTSSAAGPAGIAALPTNAVFAALPGPAQPAAAAFGDLATLRGADWTPAAPGKLAKLTLWWQARRPGPPLLVTAQVLDAQQRKWAQWDGALGGDAAPAATWQPGELVRQDVPLLLDPATPPGAYTLLVGVYDPASGARLAVTPAGQPPGPSLTLPVTIPAPR